MASYAENVSIWWRHHDNKGQPECIFPGGNFPWCAIHHKYSGRAYWNTAVPQRVLSWWRHQVETFSALLALCAGKSPVTGDFPAQRPVTQTFHVFFDLCLNKRLSKQLWGWWFEAPSRSLWRHCNVIEKTACVIFDWRPGARLYIKVSSYR